MRIVLTLQIDDRAQEWSTEAADVAAGVQELCARVVAAYPTSALFTPAADAEPATRGRRRASADDAPLAEEPTLGGETP